MAKNKKGKSKQKSPTELIIKDVCLLPTPDWNQVPRRHVKEDLVRQNLFIDAWTLDKVWSEDKLRTELHDLFTDCLSGPNDFEFVKSVGSIISKVKLPEGQEANARIIRHISGTGPIYIRSLTKLECDEDVIPVVALDNEEPPASDIRSYAVQSTISESVTPNMPSTSTSLAPCTSNANEDQWTLSDIETQQLREIFPTCAENLLIQASERCVTVDEAVDYVMNISSDQTNKQSGGGGGKKNLSLKDVLEELRPLTGSPTRVTVSRFSIFADSIACFKQRNFDLKKPLRVTFEGEPAIDGGGPKREFFTILLREFLSPSATRLFEGRNKQFLPMHNTDALRSNLYKVAGRIVAASITHGGPSFAVFPKAVYAYFQNPRPNDLVEYLSHEDVVDVEYLDALGKLDNLTKEDETIVAGELQQLLIESGFPHALTFENRFQAMMSLCLHGVILSRKAELDQFLIGLGPLVESIRQYPDVVEPLFVAACAKPPTADDLLSLVEFECVDDDLKQYFTRYVRAEDARVASILMFSTGANAIPPMGFFHPSVITVLQNNSVFPNANTCPLELELPGEVKSYEEFKRNMDSALDIQEEGFGIV